MSPHCFHVTFGSKRRFRYIGAFGRRTTSELVRFNQFGFRPDLGQLWAAFERIGCYSYELVT